MTNVQYLLEPGDLVVGLLNHLYSIECAFAFRLLFMECPKLCTYLLTQLRDSDVTTYLSIGGSPFGGSIRADTWPVSSSKSELTNDFDY